VDLDYNSISFHFYDMFYVLHFFRLGQGIYDEVAFNLSACHLVIICFRPHLEGTAIDMWAKKADISSH
jgi:hypothetical protein